MNTRHLTVAETLNIQKLNELGIPSALLYLTSTGLEKSILDATESVRRFLKQYSIHDYELQPQGPLHKREMPTLLLETNKVQEILTSLYRPKTKQGDPRIWPSRLSSYASPGDVVAIIFLYGKPGIINISNIDISADIVANTPLGYFLQKACAEARSVAEELLLRIREIASNGAIESIGHGDTTIGMTLENALGIPANSKKTPDYKGIELKSARAKDSRSAETRATLFACVPDWELSRFKSSAQILEQFGYARAEKFKLYCTVSTKRPNSQGLFLKVDEAAELLRELSAKHSPSDVAVWRVPRLETQLAAKHKETFWINARVEHRNGKEYFHIISIKHTQNPNLPHLTRLLNDGGITVDHLIKRVASGGAREKGPLFKIDRSRIPELFLGTPRIYTF